MMKYTLTTKPVVDHTKNVMEGPVRVTGPGPHNRFQTWVIVDASPEEIQERTLKESEGLRLKRDNLLSECDWTQLPDSQVDKAAWATYRQALRDVPQQPEFPWKVIWPTKP